MKRQDALPCQEVHAGCCIVGGGPAGMVLGFLLARAVFATAVSACRHPRPESW